MTVIISLSTIPNRLNVEEGFGLRECLKVLLNLTYDDYEVHLNIPAKYSKLNEDYIIPEWLVELKHPKLKLFTDLEDYGAMTKLLPTLQRITDPNTVIITVDDDLRYHRDFIEYHLKMREKYPKAAIGFSGQMSLEDKRALVTSVPKDTQVSVVQGYKTVSYLRGFFDNDFNNFIGKHWNDDFVISAYLGSKGIARIVPFHEGDTYFFARVQSWPIIGHIPCPFGGCNIFRNEVHTDNDQWLQEQLDNGNLSKLLPV